MNVTRATRNLRLKTVAWDFSWEHFRLGTFVWDLSLGIFGLGTFAEDLSLGNFRVGSFVWELSLGKCRWKLSLRSFHLKTLAWKFSLKQSRRPPPSPTTIRNCVPRYQCEGRSASQIWESRVFVDLVSNACFFDFYVVLHKMFYFFEFISTKHIK
jgi:hypothetical protein